MTAVAYTFVQQSLSPALATLLPALSALLLALATLLLSLATLLLILITLFLWLRHLNLTRHFLLHSLLVSLTLVKYMLEPVVCTLNARGNISAQAVTRDLALLSSVVDCLVKLA